MTKWLDYDHNIPPPEEEGYYAVMISGDSEYVDGQKIYDFPEYMVFAYREPDEGKFRWCGFPHDEEPEFVIAYYGPLPIPKWPNPEVENKSPERLDTAR